jgi:hypothetical protein
MSLYIKISACNHMVYLTFPFSQALSLLVFLSHRIIHKRTDANCILHPGGFYGVESIGKQ